MGVVGAAFVRDFRIFFRYPLRLLQIPLEPLVWFAPIYFLGRAFHGGPFRDYTSFALLGVAVTSYIGTVMWGIGFSLKQDMMTGVLEANWLCPASPTLQMLGRIVWSLALGTAESLLLLGVAGSVYGLRGHWHALAAAMGYIAPMLVALYGFGLGFAGLVLLVRQANVITDAGQFILSTLSGQSFPVHDLPRGLAAVALALPTTYGLNALRTLVLGTAPLLPLGEEQRLLVIMGAALAAAGAAAFWAVERRVRRAGTLGLH